MISLRSKVTQAVLNYFFLNPSHSRYVNELARLLRLDPKNLHLKLKELEREGLLKSEFIGKERHFSLKTTHPLLREYKKIFLQTVGFERHLRDILRRLPGAEEAYLFGSYAKNRMDAASDIDLLVVGNHSSIMLQKMIGELQKSAGREINVVNMTKSEFLRKKRASFLKNVLLGGHIKLL